MTFTRDDLRPYQHRAVEWIKRHEFCALWVDMGLGKTVSTLTAYADMLERFDARHALVVAPLRVAQHVWPDEIDAWSHLHGLTVSRVLGSVKERWAALKRRADIHLINRENVAWLEAQVIQNRKQVRRWPWDLVILDEAQSFRSQSSGRFKSMRRLRKLIPRMVQLTGTPSPNGYKNLWSQIYLLDQGQRLGGTEKAFRDRWFEYVPEGQYGGDWTLKATAPADIQRVLSDIVLSLKAEDWLDLPPVRTNTITVDMGFKAHRLYRDLERKALTEIKGKTVTAVNAGVVVGKLLQLANGAAYYDDTGEWVELHDAKLDALVEVVEGVDSPVIVCYAFKHDLARMQRALGKTDKRVAVVTEKDALARWNAGGVDVLLLHPASAGHGLNLQHAGALDLFWFGLTPDLELYDQANARIIGGHRRREGVTIHHILTQDTYDRDALALLRTKGATQEDLTRAIARRAAAQ